MTKIFVTAVDGSPFAVKAFHKTAHLITEGDQLILLHVIPIAKTSPLDPLHEPIDRFQNWEAEEKAKECKEKFIKLCQETKIKNYEYREIIAPDAKVAIVDFVTKIQADYLVVGSRGLGFLQRLLLGSVSTYCSEHCPGDCAVIIVH